MRKETREGNGSKRRKAGRRNEGSRNRGGNNGGKGIMSEENYGSWELWENGLREKEIVEKRTCGEGS